MLSKSCSCYGRSRLVESVFEEVENAIEDADGEVERVLEIEKQRIVTNGHGLECSQCQEEGKILSPPFSACQAFSNLLIQKSGKSWSLFRRQMLTSLQFSKAFKLR